MPADVPLPYLVLYSSSVGLGFGLLFISIMASMVRDRPVIVLYHYPTTTTLYYPTYCYSRLRLPYSSSPSWPPWSESGGSRR